MLICRNAEGVHGQRKFGDPFPKTSVLASNVYNSIRIQNELEKSQPVSLFG